MSLDCAFHCSLGLDPQPTILNQRSSTTGQLPTIKHPGQRSRPRLHPNRRPGAPTPARILFHLTRQGRGIHTLSPALSFSFEFDLTRLNSIEHDKAEAFYPLALRDSVHTPTSETMSKAFSTEDTLSLPRGRIRDSVSPDIPRPLFWTLPAGQGTDSQDRPINRDKALFAPGLFLG